MIGSIFLTGIAQDKRTSKNSCLDGRRAVTEEWVRTTRNLCPGLWFCKSFGYVFLACLIHSNHFMD